MKISNAPRSNYHESDLISNNGMVQANVHGVSVLEAEHILANVWHQVEEYGASTPHVHFGFMRDGSIDLRFTFTDPALAALVLKGLPRVAWCQRVARREHAEVSDAQLDFAHSRRKASGLNEAVEHSVEEFCDLPGLC